MAYLSSPSALIHVESDADNCTACSHPVPWRHPALRARLVQLLLPALAAPLLAGLELGGQLPSAAPGLFPLLLGLGAALQWTGLQHLRHHTLYIQANRTQVQLWEGPWGQFQPEQAQSVPWASIEKLEVIHRHSGHRRQQPLLSFSRRPPLSALTLGTGLPAAELNWLSETLNSWRDTRENP